MRVLLVTYDFPPVRTPRALRWRYLVRELVLQGHEVHVLRPDLGEVDVTFPEAPGSLHMHSSWPGPFGWLVRRSVRRHATVGEEPGVSPGTVSAPGLNWRGRLVDAAKRGCGWVLYPDVRAEWTPWARRALDRLLASIRPDVVVTSHEPATTLALGARARRAGYPWVADLGDPVCAPYTPRRWRRRAWKQEAAVCRQADRVVLTTEATRQLLIDRHGLDPARGTVLPNGYDDRRGPAPAPALDFDPARLELLYTGRLYDYRDPTGLLQAVAATPGVRLTLVLPDPPEGRAARLVEAAGERVRVTGSMPHGAVMGLLEAADVLVNVGDVAGSVQVPAKVYEYLGIERPILHVVTGRDDTVAAMLEPLSRGWIHDADPQRLARLLRHLVESKRAGTLHDGWQLAPVAAHAHSVLGARLDQELVAVCAMGNLERPESSSRPSQEGREGM